MTALALERSAVTPADRLGLTLCIAIIVHAMIVLGISFAPEPASRSRMESLEVTLVAQRAEQPPEKPDLLAQANQRGGGESESRARPSAPLPAPLPASVPEIAAPAPPPAPTVERAPKPPAAPVPAPIAAKPPVKASAARAVPRKLARRAEKAEVPVPQAPPPAPAANSAEAATPPRAEPPLPTAEQLITRSFALANLNSELQQKLDSRAKRPRQKYVSANTQEYKYAAYMEAWRAKVERIGNLNYPDEARQRKLNGNLLLDVALKPDGSVLEILVRRSSGHKVLDDGAVRIVELAAPFAPFPEDIAREVDILHVTRTWKFLNTDRFAAQ